MIKVSFITFRTVAAAAENLQALFYAGKNPLWNKAMMTYINLHLPSKICTGQGGKSMCLQNNLCFSKSGTFLMKGLSNCYVKEILFVKKATFFTNWSGWYLILKPSANILQFSHMETNDSSKMIILELLTFSKIAIWFFEVCFCWYISRRACWFF